METEEIIKFYKMLRHNQQTELRAIKPLENNNKEIQRYFISNENELIDICKKLNGEFNLYLGVNERIFNGSEAKDVKEVGIIPIDIDCINKPANDKDIFEAMNIVTKIIENGEGQGFKKPMIVYSGNGYQLFYCIPKMLIDNSNREEIENKVKEFTKRLIEMYSNDKIRIDQVGDLPRIMRIAGTFNLKSKTTSKIIQEGDGEDELLRNLILNIKLTNVLIIGGLDEELKNKIKNDNEIQKYMEGDLQGKRSRSEAELSLVCKLIQLNFNKEQIFRTLSSCKIGKWQEANVKYRELTYRKGIELICQEKLRNIDNPSIEDLYMIYKKWLWIEDTKRIDIILATYLTTKIEGTPIWIILVGKSGDGKTEQIMALKNMPEFYPLYELTSRTLVSGNDKAKDLAPELNNKFVVIPDMAQIMELPPQEKASLWAQLRNLFDGHIGKMSGYGMGVRKSYDNLRITLVGCSTPIIDGQILIHQGLGTRELIYRTEDIIDQNMIMEYSMNNEDYEKEMKKELIAITTNFLKDKQMIRKELNEKELEELKRIAEFISLIRTTAEFDSYTNELRNKAYPENPTRIIKQLKRLYLALISLDKDYKSEKAFEILWHLAKSCAFPIRISIFEFFLRDLINTNRSIEYKTNEIANNLSIGKNTAKRELSLLWNIGLVTKTERDEGSRWLPTDYWKLNTKNKFITKYMNFILSSTGNGGGGVKP